jgi:hypothetical protein
LASGGEVLGIEAGGPESFFFFASGFPVFFASGFPVFFAPGFPEGTGGTILCSLFVVCGVGCVCSQNIQLV